MAGVFLQTTKVFNRAPQALAVFFDARRLAAAQAIAEADEAAAGDGGSDGGAWA